MDRGELAKLIFGLILFTGVYLDIQYHERHQGCYIHRDIYAMKYKVRVVDKFIDHVNHGISKVKYRDSLGVIQDVDRHGMPDYFLYDDVNIGDSIIKAENSLDFRIKTRTRIQ